MIRALTSSVEPETYNVRPEDAVEGWCGGWLEELAGITLHMAEEATQVKTARSDAFDGADSVNCSEMPAAWELRQPEFGALP